MRKALFAKPRVVGIAPWTFVLPEAAKPRRFNSAVLVAFARERCERGESLEVRLPPSINLPNSYAQIRRGTDFSKSTPFLTLLAHPHGPIYALSLPLLASRGEWT